MSDEEYHARAMLLGMVYHKQSHTFYKRPSSSEVFLDADTLEAMTYDERMVRWINRNRERDKLPQR